MPIITVCGRYMYILFKEGSFEKEIIMLTCIIDFDKQGLTSLSVGNCLKFLHKIQCTLVHVSS